MSIGEIVTGEFFVYLFPWMLVLALVYGILEHYKMPKSDSSRAVISLVSAFLVLPLAPTLSGFLTGMIKNLLVVGVGILIMLIFVEMLGYKVGKGENIFDKHPVGFGIIMILIAIMVFVGAGGLELLDVKFTIGSDVLAALFFLGAMTMGVWWMTAKED
ncbi:MAG: hypothetical protein KAT37_02700 [Candidatus Aenigmarchaeota archaeon]|nr:hypothetical protein [Candidatus Aenigmarchaeota archaeon]